MSFSLRTMTVVATAAACLTLVTGCDRRTPEERLQTAVEFYQQGDTLSAEMEALKVVEKAPEDPAAVQASMLLAQIYAGQKDYEQAEAQVKSALDQVSQLEPAGKDLLRFYLSLLGNQGKYDEALKVVDQYQQEYAEDDGTSLSLTVAVADIHTQAGNTTEARTVLSDLIDRTTDTAERALYRDMYLRTHMSDGNTTAAIGYLEQNMADFSDPSEKQAALIGLASLHGANENYEQSRAYLEQASNEMMDIVRQEVDRRSKMALSVQLGQAYLGLGNLPGARRVFQAVYESGVSDPQIVVAAVNGLSENLLRLGETSATIELLQDAAAKHPQAPFKDQLQRLEEVIAKGELEVLAPMDTSTLAMKYREDPNILWPADLPAVLGGSQTTGTAAAAAAGAGATTGTVAGTTTGSATAGTAMTEAATAEAVTAGAATGTTGVVDQVAPPVAETPVVETPVVETPVAPEPTEPPAPAETPAEPAAAPADEQTTAPQ